MSGPLAGLDQATIAARLVLDGASHADSMRLAAQASEASHRDWVHFVEAWHEFFLMTGTAAVTLAGLLFVAISLHIETLIHESREHLLSLARGILFSFVMVMTISLMLLVPAQGMRVTGVELVLVGVAFGAVTLRQLRSGAADHPDFPRSVFRRRLIPTLAGYGMFAVTGIGLILTRTPEMLFLVIGAFCMLLGNAVGASWDLLVRTAKIKRRADNKADVG